jgi:signal transduction histidine kinase
MTTEMESTESVFFFPLRSNVGYFDSPQEYLSLIGRIKQASLLYDYLVFEKGIYTATVWDRGVFDTWMPPDQVSDATLDDMRDSFKPTGDESALWIQPEGGEPVALFSGEVHRRFHCEFHSALRRLDAEDLPWIHMQSFELTDKGKRLSSIIQNDLEGYFNEIETPINQFLKSKMVSNLSHDLAIISGMQASASLDAMYAPILYKRSQVQPAPGFSALQVALPNVSDLDWEQILELREQECLVQFRQKLISLESLITQMIDADVIDEANYQIALHQAMMDELLRELASALPKPGAVIGGAILDLLISSIPVPGISTAISAMRGVAIVDESRKSWVTAFLKLRRPEE